jgi:hypothetical protein
VTETVTVCLNSTNGCLEFANWMQAAAAVATDAAATVSLAMEEYSLERIVINKF